MASPKRGSGRFSPVFAGAAGLAFAAAVSFGSAASFAAAGRLTVTVGGIKDGGAIPEAYAFCVPAKEGHTKDGSNRNPSIRWSKGPAGTKSYAVIMVDRDVPSVFDDADQEGKTIPADMKRIDFYHMVIVDIPASRTEIAGGEDSNGITPGGKKPGPSPHGLRGINDYSAAFDGDPKMAGKYAGYDGPCPPWNDERVHHYHFIVYALDTPSLGLSGAFGGKEAENAIAKHVLAKGEVVGLYTQNPKLMRSMPK